MDKHPIEKFPAKEKAKDIFLIKEGSLHNTACLLLHGFSASPYNLKALAEYLHERGFTTLVPRLAGHGTDPSDLEQTTLEDWLYSARQGLERLKKDFDRVIIIGTSIGGNLALRLANEFPEEVKGLVLVGTSIKLKRHLFIKSGLPIVNKFGLKKNITKKWISRENLAKYLDEGNYDVLPLKSVAEILKLIYKYSLDDMKILRHPSLIIHSRNDNIVNYKSAKILYNNVKSETKELIIIDGNEHYPIVNTHGNEVLDKIYKFILHLSKK